MLVIISLQVIFLTIISQYSLKVTYLNLNEFKLLLIAAHDNGKTTKQIFEECGFDVETLGMKIKK